MSVKTWINGNTCYKIAERIFPILRSITGKGVRETLDILREYLPELEVMGVKSGTKVFDWTVPAEWNCDECFIEDEQGNIIIDFRQNNLHVLGYSISVDKWLSLADMEPYLYTLKDQPDAIPYVTSYYQQRWGFCLSENALNDLRNKYVKTEGKEPLFHAVIKSRHDDSGVLNYGECIIKGESDREILISTYICHPSMANNECSGPALSVVLANYIKSVKRYYSYRLVFIPETIGSITYLAQNLAALKEKVSAGFVLSCVGDNNEYSMVASRYGNTLADRTLENVLSYEHPGFKKYSYLYRGSDERQYNAPGIDLPICGFCRSKYGEYKEYHTSKDDLSYISPEGFAGALEVMTKCIDVIENNFIYRVNIFCEPQLSKRKLYPTVSKKDSYPSGIRDITNFIAYADGKNDLISISNLIGTSAYSLIKLKNKLLQNGLISCIA